MKNMLYATQRDTSIAASAMSIAAAGSMVDIPPPIAIVIEHSFPDGKSRKIPAAVNDVDVALSFTVNRLQGIGVREIVVDWNLRTKDLMVNASARGGGNSLMSLQHFYVLVSRVTDARRMHFFPSATGNWNHILLLDQPTDLFDWLDAMRDKRNGGSSATFPVPRGKKTKTKPAVTPGLIDAAKKKRTRAAPSSPMSTRSPPSRSDDAGFANLCELGNLATASRRSSPPAAQPGNKLWCHVLRQRERSVAVSMCCSTDVAQKGTRWKRISHRSV
jgi:hypothetical protein